MSLYKMKEQLAVIGVELRTCTEEVRSLAADSGASIETVRERQKYQGEIEERYNLLRTEIEREEAETRQRLKEENPISITGGEEHRMQAAMAEFIRASAGIGKISEEARNLLGAIPTPHASGGEKLMPVNIQNTLVHEPFTTNPLRKVIGVSDIPGLELPKIAYTIDDDGFVNDADTAKELKLKGDKVSFGRFKTKIKARISDTVMHGSDLSLASYVQNALNSGLAAKEKRVILAETPNTGEEHMSFYDTSNGIKRIGGTDLFKAIKNALADLHEDYRESAKIAMRFADYLEIIEALSNGNRTFFNTPPEQVLGKPVEFCDAAVNPIVGNFNFARLNYDGPMIYDTDKNVETGEYLFVVTAWYDVRILLSSAFRIANVGITDGGSGGSDGV
ncbi:MAG: phage major capsid protein [Defluviitaleaceae bacterium]|nr:phage major capsid protein [Defluviitaleaceae bacterium]MCL2263963.1 phage major capsid protein [Defluviitaleaceae bacterium]